MRCGRDGWKWRSREASAERRSPRGVVPGAFVLPGEGVLLEVGTLVPRWAGKVGTKFPTRWYLWVLVEEVVFWYNGTTWI